MRYTLRAAAHPISPLRPHRPQGLRAWRDARAGGVPFDVVLADIVMVRMNGDKMLRRMREDCAVAGEGPPLALACTGNVAPADVDSYLQAGFLQVLAKPFSVLQLADALRQCGVRTRLTVQGPATLTGNK